MEWIQTGELFEHRDSPLNTLAKGIRVPLLPNEEVLALTVLNKKSYNITNAATDPIVSDKLRETLKVNSFATVPLVAKDRVIGVILVDNMFTQRPITDGDIRFLTMFAHQAALAIENAIIHTNLETMNKDMRAMHEQLVQSEKMAALGAMMAEITHEIRNPLVSIGGFTRRLAKKLQDSEDKKYIDIILSEVARLEGIIHDNLSYIKEIAPQLADADINGLIEEILTLYEDELAQRRIRVEQELLPFSAAPDDRYAADQAGGDQHPQERHGSHGERRHALHQDLCGCLKHRRRRSRSGTRGPAFQPRPCIIFSTPTTRRNRGARGWGCRSRTGSSRPTRAGSSCGTGKREGPSLRSNCRCQPLPQEHRGVDRGRRKVMGVHICQPRDCSVRFV